MDEIDFLLGCQFPECRLYSEALHADAGFLTLTKMAQVSLVTISSNVG